MGNCEGSPYIGRKTQAANAQTGTHVELDSRAARPSRRDSGTPLSLVHVILKSLTDGLRCRSSGHAQADDRGMEEDPSVTGTIAVSSRCNLLRDSATYDSALSSSLTTSSIPFPADPNPTIPPSESD